MRQKLSILIGILFSLSLISFLWWKQAIAPLDPTNNTPIIFAVRKEESVRSIAERLQKEGLIRSPVAFFLLARFGGIDGVIQAGDFRLYPSMDLNSIADTLTHGTLDVWVTIPEGWRSEEIALKLAQEIEIPESEFLKVAKEGYMFPDTYLIPKDASAAAAVNIFLANFDKKVTDLEKNKAQNKGFSIDELITIASLVEREARFEQDRPIVASVILNRLKIGMKLDIDATVQYALGYQPQQKKWWKNNLTLEDLTVNSPYNTYINKGLPPTPICNPGLAAINAVFEAPSTDYLFYISDTSGKIHAAKTAQEHNANISQYLKK